MSLAGQQHDVSRGACWQSKRDGLAAVGLHATNILRRTSVTQPRRIVHDGQRIFRARVVGGEHTKSLPFAGGLAHQRALGAIAIASAAEQRDDFAPPAAGAARNKIASQRGEVAERIVGVRVVHNHRERLAAIDALKAPGNALRWKIPAAIASAEQSRAYPAAAAASTLYTFTLPISGDHIGSLARRRHHLEPVPRGVISIRLGMKVARASSP
jgi:hypothetical protein